MATWVIVTGDFGLHGAQDQANRALAAYLAGRGDTVHLVAHTVDDALRMSPGVRVHRVPRPLGSHLAGQPLLDLAGRKVAREVLDFDPGARVVVNGGNCDWPDVNWVHSVHHAWPCRDSGAPFAFRIKNRLAKSLARRSEARALKRAAIVFANSARTRLDLVHYLSVEATRIRVQYLGCDPSRFHKVLPEERRAARERLRLDDGVTAVLFVGSLGYDSNKGFDTLLSAWHLLSGSEGWNGLLLAAGGGAVRHWQRRLRTSGLAETVRFLGFTMDVPGLLAAADVLVSPSRYEAYGLGVQEALCRGVPAIVSSTAGIAERYAGAMTALLLPDPENASDLAARLLDWRANRGRFESLATGFGQTLRSLTWSEMASGMVRVIEEGERTA